MFPRAVVPAIFLCAAILRAEPPEWPQFRGPNCTGIAANARPPVEFGPEKNLLWKTPIPGGASSPVIAGDRIFLTGFEDGKLVVLCVKRSDGGLLWKRPVATDGIEPFFQKLGTPAGPSCATDGERVVSYFGSCGLVCHDLDGNEVWKLKMPVVQTMDGFGTGNSPIIHEGRVYLTRDEYGEAAGFYCLDVKTGKQIWRTDRSDVQVCYGTPVIWDGALVTVCDLRVKAYDLATGAERWLARGIVAYPCTTAAAGSDGRLYVSTWSNGSGNEPNPDFNELLAKHDKDKDGKLSAAELAGTPMKDFLVMMDDNKNGALDREEWENIQTYMRTGKNAVLAIQPGGKGDITETHVAWRNEKGAAYVASPLAFDGRLYLVKDGGFATCYDTATGRILFEKQRLPEAGDYYASPVAAGGHIYVCSGRGSVLVLKPGDKLDVIANHKLGEPIFATPAFVGNAIYIRTGGHLWAFGTK